MLSRCVQDIFWRCIQTMTGPRLWRHLIPYKTWLSNTFLGLCRAGEVVQDGLRIWWKDSPCGFSPCEESPGWHKVGTMVPGARVSPEIKNALTDLTKMTGKDSLMTAKCHLVTVKENLMRKSLVAIHQHQPITSLIQILVRPTADGYTQGESWGPY